MTDDTNLELCETFVAESSDYIDELEPQFIELSEAIAQGDRTTTQHLMNHIFRLIHTIKGSAGSLGFKNIAALAHKAENLLDSIRHHRIELTAHRLELLTGSLDVFRTMLSILQQKHNDDGTEHLILELAEAFDKANKDEAAAPKEKTTPPAVEVSSGFFVFEDEKEPHANPAVKINTAMRSAFVQEGEENLAKVELCLLAFADQKAEEKVKSIEEALRILHSFKGNCGFMQLHDMESLVHAMETTLQDVEKGHATDEKMEDLLRATDCLKSQLPLVAAETYQGIPELHHLLSQLGVVPDLKSAAAKKPEPTKASALNEIKSSLESARNSASAARSDVRVDLKKLDALINLVGELVVAEAMVTGWVKNKSLEDEDLDRAIHHLKRTTLNLQDVAMSVRMVPVNQTFKKMVRLVHDTSTRLNKKVRLALVGEDTEVDKTVIEQIADPLVHCVRNSIDHGLETPEDRLKSGKEATGLITLEARHEGGEVWIVIQDDGRGLNREKILDRARSRNLFPLEKEHLLTDAEIFNFIFEPGFSTAEQVTDVSGRGVGMDVVKKNIEKVKGKIRIESTAGAGTRIIFQIPLTLAIIEGMMIRVGTSKYTIPLLTIQESIRISPDLITTGPDGLDMIDVRSNFIPIVRLDDLMNKNQREKREGECIVVVVEVNDKSIALVVDEILGQQQTVIKALPAIYKHSKNVSGCSILANGDVSLILDVAGIAETLSNEYDTYVSTAA